MNSPSSGNRDNTFRLLFVSDTHLGFDFPFRPRVKRRRRGPDFFKNFNIALEPALKKEVDAVIHGGDILFRSKVPAQLVQMAFEPLVKVADAGTPVYVVPGNHERSAIPYRMPAAHPNIYIFDRPTTFRLEKNGSHLALAGFPYVRNNIRETFPQVLEQTGWSRTPADASVLCMHHCVEGATLIMGPRLFTFRNTHDVIKPSDISPGFSAVLSGHIHRFQVLTRDLQGRSLPAPVFYPGSVERTSFQEKDEDKGYLTLDIAPTPAEESRNQPPVPGRGVIKHWQFHQLPARPMKILELRAQGMNPEQLKSWIKQAISHLPEDSVVKLRVHGTLSPEALSILGAESLRGLTAPTMNVSLTLGNYRRRNQDSQD